MRTRLADDADEFRVDLGSGGVVEPSRWEGTTMSTMTSVRANGVEVGGMVAQVAALYHPDAFSALTLVSTRPVAPGPVDDDLPDHDAATMDAVFSRPMPDWTDRSAVAAFAADGTGLLGDDPEQAARPRHGSGTAHRRASLRCSRRIGTGPQRPAPCDSLAWTSATGGFAGGRCALNRRTGRDVAADRDRIRAEIPRGSLCVPLYARRWDAPGGRASRVADELRPARQSTGGRLHAQWTRNESRGQRR
jgi:pimeloyl-ACP methyl ester carboxylesterase